MFDTPADDASARELIDYLTQEIDCKINGVVATHFHANVVAWPETARRAKAKYPRTFVVIPGHGKAGGQELLDCTASLLE